MWPHTRVAWWDVKRWLALRGRRIVAAVTLTGLAGSGLAASEYFGTRSTGPGLQNPPPSASPPPTTTPTLVPPTLPWPGSTP